MLAIAVALRLTQPDRARLALKFAARRQRGVARHSSAVRTTLELDMYKHILLNPITSAIAAILVSGAAHAAGALDSTFGTGGLVLTDFNLVSNRAAATVIQADGKTVVVGSAEPAGGIALARYGTTGNIELKLTMPAVVADGQLQLVAQSVALQADGKLIVAGPATRMRRNGTGSLSPVAWGMFAYRFNPDGSVDTSFGNQGQVTAFFTGNLGPNLVRKALVLSSGKIWLLGEIDAQFDAETALAAVAAFNADGSPDTELGDAGKLIVEPPNAAVSGVPFSSIFDAVEHGSGVVVVGGASLSSSGAGEAAMVIGKLDSRTGLYDPSFGNGGRTRVPAGFGEAFTSVVALADGRLVAAGSLAGLNGFGSTSWPLRLRRFDARGAVDASYAEPLVGLFAQPRLARTGNRVWVATTSRLGNSSDMALRALTEGGAVDATFGTGGALTINFGAEDSVADLAAQADGKLMVVGSRAVSIFGGADFALARVSPAARGGTPPPPPQTPSVPVAPSNVTAFADSPNAVTVRWTDRSDNETGYVVDRALRPDFLDAVRVASLPADATSFTNNGLARRTTYYYRVFAVNAAGNSAASATATVTTPRR